MFIQKIKGLDTNASEYITRKFPRVEVMSLPTITCPTYLHPYNYHIITLVRAGERDVIGLLKEEIRKREQRQSIFEAHVKV